MTERRHRHENYSASVFMGMSARGDVFYRAPARTAGAAFQSSITRTSGWAGSKLRMLSDAVPRAKCCDSITGRPIHCAATTRENWPWEKSDWSRRSCDDKGDRRRRRARPSRGLVRPFAGKTGVDPLGGAGVHYWSRIAEQYGLNLTVVNDVVDPTFRFMTVDWDGRIRMDPSSSSHGMQSLIGLKDRFDIAFACDTDHDRHGIVTKSAGLLPPNHYLSVAVFYLFEHRPKWDKNAAVGKTVVSSQMIDRITAKLGRKLNEVLVGFRWFVGGLLDGSLGFGGEESAGASFARLDGSVWTTDQDGIVPALLSAEITARMGRDPGEIYRDLAREFGEPAYDRVEAPATAEQKHRLARLSPLQILGADLACEKIRSILTEAPGNGASVGGLKVIAETGWFAARPSGTEDIYKIYAESFIGADHLHRVLTEAQAFVDAALATPTQRTENASTTKLEDGP